MTIAFTLAAASFIFVFLKAFQQLNVVRGHYLLVPPISLCMAATEVYVIAAVAVQGFSLSAVMGMGTGGACGAICAMYFHTNYLGVKS